MREHTVSKPRAPFESSSGALIIHQVPAWVDNLCWVVELAGTGTAAVVDGPEAGAVLAYCEARGLRLTTVINTHTHFDHIGVNADLQKRGLLEGMRVIGPAKVADAVPGITERVSDGDTVTLGDATGRVMLTEGHIDGHVSYVFDDVLFCGDTLFCGGCGYLFDGPPEAMHASLQRLAGLDGGTRVCCAHEYTQDNLRFAWSVEPDNEALARRIREVWAIRGRGECTVPSTVGDELATNPFLRTASATLRGHVADALGRSLDPDEPASVFAATRALKDRKDYRSITDDALPLAE